MATPSSRADEEARKRIVAWKAADVGGENAVPADGHVEKHQFNIRGGSSFLRQRSLVDSQHRKNDADEYVDPVEM